MNDVYEIVGFKNQIFLLSSDRFDFLLALNLITKYSTFRQKARSLKRGLIV